MRFSFSEKNNAAQYCKYVGPTVGLLLTTVHYSFLVRKDKQREKERKRNGAWRRQQLCKHNNHNNQHHTTTNPSFVEHQVPLQKKDKQVSSVVRCCCESVCAGPGSRKSKDRAHGVTDWTIFPQCHSSLLSSLDVAEGAAGPLHLFYWHRQSPFNI